MRHSKSSDQLSSARHDVQQAAIAAARITGWAALDRGAIVAKFRDRAPRSTLYHWLAAINGAPLDRTVPEMVRDARLGGSPRLESVVAEVQSRATAILPQVPSIAECVAAVTPAHVLEKIHKCLTAGEEVMGKARGVDGQVRNAKLMLSAAEHLRRSLETAVKLQEAISDGLQIERFHAVILEEIEKIDPVVARRIVTRLQDVNAAWQGNLKKD